MNVEKGKNTFLLGIAGRVIEVHSLYDKCRSMCSVYVMSNEKKELVPDFVVDIALRNIKRENDLSQKKNADKKEMYLYNDPGYMEYYAVHRKISEEMPSFDTVLMHGAVIAYHGSAYLFTATSGTGKTTHVRKWLNHLEDAYVVNGDKPFLRITDTEVTACGAPWCGKEKMGKNCMVTLKAIVLINRGEKNKIEEISFEDAFETLIGQTYQPQRIEQMKKTLDLLMRMKGKVQFYRFYCNMDDDAFTVAYEALTGDRR